MLMSPPWKERWEELAQYQEMVLQALKVAVSPSFPRLFQKIHTKETPSLILSSILLEIGSHIGTRSVKVKQTVTVVVEDFDKRQLLLRSLLAYEPELGRIVHLRVIQ